MYHSPTEENRLGRGQDDQLISLCGEGSGRKLGRYRYREDEVRRLRGPQRPEGGAGGAAGGQAVVHHDHAPARHRGQRLAVAVDPHPASHLGLLGRYHLGQIFRRQSEVAEQPGVVNRLQAGPRR